MMCIQDYFLHYYDWRPFRWALANKVVGNTSKVFGVLANAVLPLFFRRSPGLDFYARRKREGAEVTDAVICITSFPRRAPYLWLVIETLLRQQMLPWKIVLYLSRDQFPNDTDIPFTLHAYKEAGILSIRMVSGDIRSHKKYWYAVKEFEGYPIITVDDDIIYHSSIIARLTHAAHEHPDCISCLWWGPMVWDEQGNVKPMSQWKVDCCTRKTELRADCFFGSGGGTYFPSGSLAYANSPICDIVETCPTADDIWLNAIIRHNGFRIIGLSHNACVPSWAIKDNIMLCTENDGPHHRNDEQLFAVRQYFIKHMGGDPFKQQFFNNI